MKPSIAKTKLHEVMQDTVWSDKMYLFLQAIFNLFPEDRFHLLLKESIENGQTEEEVYHFIQANLKKISPPFSAFTYALPSLRKQKKVISEQCAQLIGTTKPLKGYVEIGSTGRYINALKKVIPLKGTVYTVNDIAPSYQIPDLFERGQIKFNSNFIALDYFPLNKHIPLKSTSLVTCFIGLHHCPLELLPAFIQSIHDILSDDGLFILRDHDCDHEEIVRFADVIHTVFNIGTQVSFEQNQNEFRNFQSMNYWIELIEKAGFRQIGEKLLQKNDPSINTMVMFQKQK